MTIQMTTNEAAERLRTFPYGQFTGTMVRDYEDLIDAALATERRATVERIREMLMSYEDAEAFRKGKDPTADGEVDYMLAILDEEAAR